MLLSIIIPVYNEEQYIKKLLLKINAIKDLEKEIIIINDCSNDETKNILVNECKLLYSKLINNDKNMGKGFSCKVGIKAASGKIVLIQDADLEYNPNDYTKLIKPILDNEAKVVYGSRVLPGGNRIRPKTFDFIIRYFANWFLTFFSNMLNKQNLTDCHTCYKVFLSEVIKKIHLEEHGFCFCPEITAKISKLGIKIKEVPIDYFGRTHSEGKKISYFDGLKALNTIVKYNLIKKR